MQFFTSCRYEQFLHVGRLYRVLILLGLALYLPGASVSSVFMVLVNLFAYILFLHSLVSWWWGWPLIWLTNHCPLLLWRCWLGHLTRKIVPEVTYNVSSGMLNRIVPIQLYCHLQSLRSYVDRHVTDRQTDRQTDRRTDGRTDGSCHNANVHVS